MDAHDYDDDFYDDEIPAGMVICDRCNGDGTINCYCCGANDELPCGVCHGEGYITEARWEKRRAAHREMMKALWPEHYAEENDAPTPPSPSNPQQQGETKS